MNETLVTILVAIFASGGFWAFLQTWLNNRSRARSAEQRLILGLAFRQIVELCDLYITRGYIDTEEYKELAKYLFEPYKEMGGNGTAARLIREVEKLPMRKEIHHD